MTMLLTRLMLFVQGRLAEEERGASTVEYGLLLVAVAAAAIAVGLILKTRLTALFDGISFS